MLKDVLIKLKDAHRVRRYIKRHVWYDSFERIASNRSLTEYLSIIYGFRGIFTIRSIPWKDTLQGYKYWMQVDKIFSRWYYYGEE